MCSTGGLKIGGSPKLSGETLLQGMIDSVSSHLLGTRDGLIGRKMEE
jgi:hypothetical protein